MTITLVANGAAPEHQAARQLAAMAEEAWPALRTAADSKLIVHACYPAQTGGRGREIDLVVAGEFGPACTVPAPRRWTGRDGEDLSERPVHIRELCLVIEVKDHPTGRWRMHGETLEVEYAGEWHDAIQSNIQQMHALRDHLLRFGEPPFVLSFVWLRNALRTDFSGSTPPNVLTGDMTWTHMMQAVLRMTEPHTRAGQLVYAPSRQPLTAMLRRLERQFTGSERDMQFVNNVIKREVRPEWMAAVGQAQLTFRGYPGTGKTAVLLQIAHQLVKDRRSHVLILTYNRLLAANLHRILVMLGQSVSDTGVRMKVLNFDKFLRSFSDSLGLPTPAADYTTWRDETMATLLRRIADDPDATRNTARENGCTFLDSEFVFVDEGQDTSESEFRLLRALWPARNTVVADGIDQFTRLIDDPCNWEADLRGDASRSIFLDECLRMKQNLATFANTLASNMGLDWKVRPSSTISGGEVILVQQTDGFIPRALFDKCLDRLRETNVVPVDTLIMVPRSRIARGDGGSYDHAMDAETLREWGHPVHDGVASANRDSTPQDDDMFRLVPYTSCRGLEGWLTIAIGLDEIFDFQVDQFRRLFDERMTSQGLDGIRNDDAIHREAAKWTMVPLSRCIDRLVITYDAKKNSRLVQALNRSITQCRDFVSVFSEE